MFTEEFITQFCEAASAGDLESMQWMMHVESDRISTGTHDRNALLDLFHLSLACAYNPAHADGRAVNWITSQLTQFYAHEHHVDTQTILPHYYNVQVPDLIERYTALLNNTIERLHENEEALRFYEARIAELEREDDEDPDTETDTSNILLSDADIVDGFTNDINSTETNIRPYGFFCDYSL